MHMVSTDVESTGPGHDSKRKASMPVTLLDKPSASLDILELTLLCLLSFDVPAGKQTFSNKGCL